ncbi:MAG: DNA helicase RecQ [Oscillospiraceae bacterium]|nr:DNA helicase RecQ [Oscillospiraceae bacterium]
MDKYQVLAEYFGFHEFRQGQDELIDGILSGRDVMGVMPTGAGKSLCFQLPAVMLPGMTVVVSPLISLMKDQVSALTQCGIRAAYINGSLTEKQISVVMNRARNHEYKIIYVAPERLDAPAFCELCRDIEISMICVDEAHCVSQWGQDFRPSYLKISSFIAGFARRPVVCAFTATATKRVRDDIVRLIGLADPIQVVTGFDRENLYFEVVKPKDKLVALRRYLDLYSGTNGIVYCSSRKAVDELTQTLSEERYSVTAYHAGMPASERKRSQELFIQGEKEIIIATNAFGMGIDKSNVSFVIHYNMPGDIESYYQEAGRAGRDGSAANCVLLYSPNDVRIQKYFIDNPEDNPELTEKEKRELYLLRMDKLNHMINYCTKAPCLRNYILRYFGENPVGRCGNCSACNGSGMSIDITLQAQMIFSCIKRVREREDKEVIADILKGDATDYITYRKYDKIKTFGAMSDTAKSQILLHIDYFLSHMFIGERNGKLYLEEKSKDILYSGKRVRRLAEKQENKTLNKQKPLNVRLFLELKALRREFARKMSLPDFIIFTDATLRDMATAMPDSRGEMLKIAGVNERKYDKYGAAFLKVIIKHRVKDVAKAERP